MQCEGCKRVMLNVMRFAMRAALCQNCSSLVCKLSQKIYGALRVLKNAVFWNVMRPCGSCKNGCFGGTYRLHFQDEILWDPLCLQPGCTSRRTRKRSSFNGISIVVSICYRGDTVNQPLLRRMWWLTSHLYLPFYFLLLINLIRPVALGPGVRSVSNRNEYITSKIIFLGSKATAGSARKADNITAAHEQIV
jgi:hypothetical protein